MLLIVVLLVDVVDVNTELRSLFDKSMHQLDELRQLLANDFVTWHFIPPGAPHMGGLWEAAVKSVKHHLLRVIGHTKLTFEEMSTLLIQIEACTLRIK